MIDLRRSQGSRELWSTDAGHAGAEIMLLPSVLADVILWVSGHMRRPKRFGHAGAHMRRHVPEEHDRENFGAEELETRPMRIEAEPVEQTLEVIRPSFSGSEEAITFQIPFRMKRDFEVLFRQVRGEQQAK